MNFWQEIECSLFDIFYKFTTLLLMMLLPFNP